jgi:hypothetical protein
MLPHPHPFAQICSWKPMKIQVHPALWLRQAARPTALSLSRQFGFFPGAVSWNVYFSTKLSIKKDLEAQDDDTSTLIQLLTFGHYPFIIILLLFLVGWDWVSWYWGHYWPIVPAPDDRWWWLWGEKKKKKKIGRMKIVKGNRSTRRKPAPAPVLSTTNPTWLEPDANSGRRGGKPATNCFSYSAALDVTHRPVFICNNVTETGLCLRPQVKKKNLLTWAQSIELVPISGHQNQHKPGYASINWTQHKPFARVKSRRVDNVQNVNHWSRKCSICCWLKGEPATIGSTASCWTP